jgi:hypothetical protein
MILASADLFMGNSILPKNAETPDETNTLNPKPTNTTITANTDRKIPGSNRFAWSLPETAKKSRAFGRS